MELLGALQPGLPTPTAIPKQWPLIIIDLKDCFYTIAIHPKDKEKFAFSIPSTNSKEPMGRYQWIVLPQGMTNSPTMCQYYVGQVLRPVRKHYSRSYIIHYMDDILLASQTETELQNVYQATSQHLTSPLRNGKYSISQVFLIILRDKL